MHISLAASNMTIVKAYEKTTFSGWHYNVGKKEQL